MRKSTLGISALVVGACSSAAVAAGCSHESVSVAPPPLSFADSGSRGSASSGPHPTFKATVVAATPPPPISGGTLLVAHDGTVVASDPDRDAVYGIDETSSAVRFTVTLQAGDEPGRIAEDGAGRVHVALRGSGALVTIDLATGQLLARRSVCPAPRGVTWDSTNDTVLVACATGELVTLPSAGGALTASLHVDRDLRDVVVQSDGTFAITSFRAAEVLRVSRDGTVTRRDGLRAPDPSFVPHVAWRAVAGPSDSLIAVHQAESMNSISTMATGGYGGSGFGDSFVGDFVDASLPTGAALDSGFLFEGEGNFVLPPVQAPDLFDTSIVRSVITILGADGSVEANRSLNGVLPVDVALSLDGRYVATAMPGSAFTPGVSDIEMLSIDGSGVDRTFTVGEDVQPIAVAFDATGQVLVQTREPAQLWVIGQGPNTAITLSTVSRDDTGHDVFHTQAGAAIACASCHPEGGDDGHVWVLDGNQRRTLSMRGTIAGTAPYHWPGDEADLPTLVNDVYSVRMAGAMLPEDQMTALTGWVQTIPPPPAPAWVDANAVSLGKAIFERSDTQCTVCHSGPKFTNNTTVDVGTGGAFQVPPLVGVGWRTPLMHDGCATTIAERFGSSCATPQHGNTAGLSTQDVANLSAYLETL